MSRDDRYGAIVNPMRRGRRLEMKRVGLLAAAGVCIAAVAAAVGTNTVSADIAIRPLFEYTVGEVIDGPMAGLDAATQGQIRDRYGREGVLALWAPGVDVREVKEPCSQMAVGGAAVDEPDSKEDCLTQATVMVPKKFADALNDEEARKMVDIVLVIRGNNSVASCPGVHWHGDLQHCHTN